MKAMISSMITEKQIGRALIGEVRKELNIKFGENSLSIGHIQHVVKLYFSRVIKDRELLSQYTVMPLQFTDADCLWIANVAVAHFLEYWLENDYNARQTIYAFTQSPFSCKDEVDTDKLSRADSDMCIQLGRARDKYCRLQRRRNEQITDDEINAEVVAEDNDGEKSKKNTYSFIELCWFDMWSNEKQLSLLDLISFGFQPDRQYTEDWWVKQLSAAYPKYYANLDRIDRLSISKDMDTFFNPYILRQYVTSCMVIRKIEQANRFALIANIAQNKDLAANDFRKDVYYSAIYWGRYPASQYRVIKFNEKSLNGKIVEDRPLDVGNYEEAIKVVFGASTIKKDVRVEQHRVLRTILTDIIHLLYELYPTEILPHWRNKEFSEAAFFYRRQYPFVAEFLQCTVPDNDKEFYLNCKKQFQELARVENSQFNKIIYSNAEEKLEAREKGK